MKGNEIKIFFSSRVWIPRSGRETRRLAGLDIDHCIQGRCWPLPAGVFYWENFVESDRGHRSKSNRVVLCPQPEHSASKLINSLLAISCQPREISVDLIRCFWSPLPNPETLCNMEIWTVVLSLAVLPVSVSVIGSEFTGRTMPCRVLPGSSPRGENIKYLTQLTHYLS